MSKAEQINVYEVFSSWKEVWNSPVSGSNSGASFAGWLFDVAICGTGGSAVP